MRILRLSGIPVFCFLVLSLCLGSQSALRARGKALSSVEIPILVDHGNAVVPVVGSYDGYAALPPDLVVVSVPFAKGVLTPNVPLTVYDASDRPLPTQSSILARWDDGTVRWAQLRFNSHLDIPKWSERFYGNPQLLPAKTLDGKLEQREVNTNLPWDFRVRAGSSPPAPAVGVTVTQAGETIAINNGRIVVQIDPKSEGFGFSQISVHGMERTVSGPLRLEVRYADATLMSTSGLRADEVRIEERALICRSGELPQTHRRPCCKGPVSQKRELAHPILLHSRAQDARPASRRT